MDMYGAQKREIGTDSEHVRFNPTFQGEQMLNPENWRELGTV